MRLPPRLADVALLVAAAGCASVAPAPRRLRAVPADALRSGWAATRVDDATRALLSSLATEGLDALRRRRIRHDERAVFLDDRGQARAAGSVVGMSPRPSERRWVALRRLRGARLAGWCARGVRVHDPGGAEGFAQPALTVDRLLVVAEDDRGLVGFWVEGVVLDDDGWRWLPWVPWADAVEAPRADHSDIALWVCDLERRPARR